jgi:hypothetical protein
MSLKPYEVVGVVGEGRYWSITHRACPVLFLPLAQNFRGRVTLVPVMVGLFDSSGE